VDQRSDKLSDKATAHLYCCYQMALVLVLSDAGTTFAFHFENLKRCFPLNIFLLLICTEEMFSWTDGVRLGHQSHPTVEYKLCDDQGVLRIGSPVCWSSVMCQIRLALQATVGFLVNVSPSITRLVITSRPSGHAALRTVQHQAQFSTKRRDTADDGDRRSLRHPHRGGGLMGHNCLRGRWSTRVSPLAIALAFFVSFLVGQVFGVYPAIKAARLEPVDALRYE
jgi:hypothetical protein